MSLSVWSSFVENKEKFIMFDKSFRSSITKFQGNEIIEAFRTNLQHINNDAKLQERAIVVLGFSELNFFSLEELFNEAVLFLRQAKLYDFISSRQERPIHYAAALGNLAFLRHLVLISKDTLNSTTAYGATPLHLACGVNNPDCISSLLENGADISITTPDGSSPLNLWRLKSGQSLLPFKELDLYSLEFEKRKILAQVIENEGSSKILGKEIRLFGLAGWMAFYQIGISLRSFFEGYPKSQFSKDDQLALVNAFSKAGKYNYYNSNNFLKELKGHELMIVPIENIFPEHCVNIVHYKNNLVFCDTSVGNLRADLYPISYQATKLENLAEELFDKNWKNYNTSDIALLLPSKFEKLYKESNLDDEEAKENLLALNRLAPLLIPKAQEVNNCTHASALAALRIGSLLLKHPLQLGEEEKIFSELEQFKTYHAIRVLEDYLKIHQDSRTVHLKDYVLINKSLDFIENRKECFYHAEFIVDYFSYVKKLNK